MSTNQFTQHSLSAIIPSARIGKRLITALAVVLATTFAVPSFANNWQWELDRIKQNQKAKALRAVQPATAPKVAPKVDPKPVTQPERRG